MSGSHDGAEQKILASQAGGPAKTIKTVDDANSIKAAEYKALMDERDATIAMLDFLRQAKERANAIQPIDAINRHAEPDVNSARTSEHKALKEERDATPRMLDIAQKAKERANDIQPVHQIARSVTDLESDSEPRKDEEHRCTKEESEWIDIGNEE